MIEKLKSWFLVFIDRVKVDQFRLLMLKSGPYYFLLLRGINAHLVQGKLAMEPVYFPLVGIRNDGGQRSIELYFWRDCATVIFLFNRWPFAYFYKIEKIQLEYEEEE